MAIRDKIRGNVAPLLQPGEQIQAVIPAQTTSQYFVLISYWIIIFSNAYRIIVATDRRIVVIRSGRLSMTKAAEVLRELPRRTPIGPPAGLWYRTDALGEKLYINRRFFKDVEEADRLAGLTAAPPPPPPPA